MDDEYPVVTFTPSRDDGLLYFRGHTDLVFIVDLSPSAHLAVSGGKDDRGWLWNVDDGNAILELTGFKDSVPFVGFSHDEKFVMAADMAGNVCGLPHGHLRTSLVYDDKRGSFTFIGRVEKTAMCNGLNHRL